MIIKALKYSAIAVIVVLAATIVGLNIWGAMSLGTIGVDHDAARDNEANKVVMVLGATGSAGDGLLKAAIEDPDVESVHVITRRMSPRIEQGAADGRVVVHMHEDFTDYSGLAPVLAEVNTVLWGLGTTSIGMDPDTYTWIHVDFPTAFVAEWLKARQTGAMAFHYVTGMGTGEEESARWAQDKGRAERLVAEMAEGTDLRTFGYRSAWIRPTSENSNALVYLLEWMLKPGGMVIRGIDLGGAMLEISARRDELANGTLIDQADSIAYAKLYRDYLEAR